MAFLIDIPDLPPLSTPAEEISSRYAAYREYLERNKDRMPAAVFAFATADWHFDYQAAQALHDAWVERLTIVEPAEGERSQYRSIDIEVRLKGIYHDGYTEIRYRKVRSYSLSTPAEFELPPSYRTGHGDWLIDEISLSDRGLVVHEIRFSRGSRWVIGCEDIEHEWVPDPAKDDADHHER
jgi:hypothetical protein